MPLHNVVPPPSGAEGFGETTAWTALRKAVLRHGMVLKDEAIAYDLRRVLLDSTNLEMASDLVWTRVLSLKPDVIYGRGYGAAPLINAVLLRAGQDGYPLKGLMLRHERKTYSGMRIVEGPTDIPKGARAVFIDDLFNTGNTFRNSLKALVEDGYDLETVGLVSLVSMWNVTSRRVGFEYPVLPVYYRHDLSMSRRSRDLLNFEVGLKWARYGFNIKAPKWVTRTAPRIDGNQLLVADDLAGVWSFDLDSGNPQWQSPGKFDYRFGKGAVNDFEKATGPDLYVSDYYGCLRKLDKSTGEEAWRVRLDQFVHSTPWVEGDDLWVATEGNIGGDKAEGSLLRINARDGTILWRQFLGGLAPCSPLVHEKRVFVGSNNHMFRAFDAISGLKLWELQGEHPIKGRAAVTPAGIVTCDESGLLRCLDPASGEVKWLNKAGATPHAMLSYDAVNDQVVISNGTGLIGSYASADGKLKWINRLRDTAAWRPTPLDNNRLLFVSRNGHFTIHDAAQGTKLWAQHVIGRTRIHNPPAALCHADGSITVALNTQNDLLVYKVNPV